MARIPDVMTFGRRPTSEAMPAAAVSRGGLILADAVQDSAAGVMRAGAVLQEREDRFSYAKAKSTLLQADIEARRELENDPDYGTYESRYRERMAKAREVATGLIRSQRDRVLFDEDAKLDVERGSFDVSRQAWAREVDVERGNLDGLLEKNRAAALNAKDEATRAALVEAAGDLIEGARQKRYLNEQEATNLQQKWTAEYGKGFVLMQPVDEQIRLLSKPQGTVADFIDPAERSVMLDRAKKEQEQEERARAQEERSRIQQARSNAEWAQRQNADAAWKMVAAGKTVADIQREAPGVWRGMDGRDQMALLNDEKSRVDGGKTPTDWGRYYELRQMAREDPEGFRALPLERDFDKLAPGERKELISLQQSAPGSVDDLDAVGLSKQVEIATAGWKNKEKKGLFERRVNETVYARNRELGRKLSQAERQQVIDDLLIEGEVRDGGLWNSDRQRFEIDETQTTQFVPEGIADEFDTIPEQDKLQIKQALATKNLPQTPENVLAVYRASKAQ